MYFECQLKCRKKNTENSMESATQSAVNRMFYFNVDFLLHARFSSLWVCVYVCAPCSSRPNRNECNGIITRAIEKFASFSFAYPHQKIRLCTCADHYPYWGPVLFNVWRSLLLLFIFIMWLKWALSSHLNSELYLNIILLFIQNSLFVSAFFLVNH